MPGQHRELSLAIIYLNQCQTCSIHVNRIESAYYINCVCICHHTTPAGRYGSIRWIQLKGVDKLRKLRGENRGITQLEINKVAECQAFAALEGDKASTVLAHTVVITI